MSVIFSLSPNGNHKNVKVVSLSAKSGWSDLFTKVTNKLSMKPKRVFTKDGKEIDINSVNLADLADRHLIFSDGSNFVGFKKEQVNVRTAEPVSKRAISIKMGSIAYLTKPAKYDFTVVYDDKTTESFTTIESEGNKFADKHGLVIGSNGWSDSELERECF